MCVTSVYFPILDGKLLQDKVQSMMYFRQSSSGGKSTCSSVVSLSSTPVTEIRAEGNTFYITPNRALECQ